MLRRVNVHVLEDIQDRYLLDGFKGDKQINGELNNERRTMMIKAKI